MLVTRLDFENMVRSFEHRDDVQSLKNEKFNIKINDKTYNIVFFYEKLLYESVFDDRYLNNRNESVKIEIFFDNSFKVIQLVRRSDSNKECTKESFVLANILEIDDKGFVTFEVINRSTFQEAETTATQVYAILKEIYHIHTHHHKDTDMLLRPIHITSQDAKPYDKILNEYEEKIISYHNEINKNNIFGQYLSHTNQATRL